MAERRSEYLSFTSRELGVLVTALAEFRAGRLEAPSPEVHAPYVETATELIRRLNASVPSWVLFTEYRDNVRTLRPVPQAECLACPLCGGTNMIPVMPERWQDELCIVHRCGACGYRHEQ